MKIRNNLKAAKPPKVITDLRHLVYSSAEKFGNKTLYFYYNNDKKLTEYSYQTLKDEVIAIGTAFCRLHIAGAHIAVSGDTHPHYIASYLASVTTNSCIVPIDKELSVESTADFLNLSECVAFIYTAAQSEKAKLLQDLCPGIRYFIAIQPGDDFRFCDSVYTMDELLEIGKAALDEGDTSYEDIELEMDTMSALLFTSGTTGTSKGVMLSHRNLAAATNATCHAVPYDDRNTCISVLPPHHSYEMTCGHLAQINFGVSILINDSLKHVTGNIRSYKPDTLMLVPLFVETMHKKIWEEIRKKNMVKQTRAIMKMNRALYGCHIDMRDKLFKQVQNAFGGNLKSIVCGGAPLSPQLVRDFHAFGITILEGYGITECAPLVSVNPYTNAKLGSVGLPVRGCKVKIDKLPNEETGEILVKGDNVMLGYYKDEAATAEAFTKDGWFRTGDIGYMDKDGYIFITGRKKDVIILSNGKNVFPEELEEYLAALPCILESVVLARKNDAGDQIITAVVVPNEEILGGKSKEEVYAEIKAAIAIVNHKLPSFKQIRKVEVRYKKFERTTSKKIQRFKVN